MIPEGKRSLGEGGGGGNIIKVDLKETWCEGVDWIKLSQEGVQ
jgi:hypothetical protein